MSSTVSFYNYDSNLIKVAYTGGAENGIDRFYKKSDISFINNGDFVIIKTPTERISIEYAYVSTTNPSYHTNSSELIAVLETWLTLDIDKVAAADTFSRQRQVQMVTLFDSVFKASTEVRKYHLVTGSGATISHDANEECVNLVVPVTSSSYAIYQTKPYLHFTQGAATVAQFSCILRTAASVTNNTISVGLFDNNGNKGVTGDTGGSGCFFQLNSSGLAVVTRNFTGGVQSDTTVLKPSWNVDKMDGYGLSGITLDPTKINTYVIECSTDGAGTIRFGVITRSKIWYCHVIDSTNVRTNAPLESGCLPFRVESSNVGVAGATSTTRIYSVYIATEGENFSKFYTGRYISNAFSATAVKQITGTNNHVITLSVAPGVRCRDRICIKSSSFLPIQNYYGRHTVVLNGTLGGTTTWVNVTDSALRYSITNTTCAGGTLLYSSMVGNNNRDAIVVYYDMETINHMFGAFDGVTGDTITFTLSDAGAPNVNFYYSVNWVEYY